MTIPIDSAYFRRILGHYPTGICIITSIDAEGAPLGMVVGSFTSVSLDPPLVGFLPTTNSESWRRIGESGRFCVNVLSSQQETLCRTFASRIPDKYAGIDYRLSPGGLPIFDGAIAWIECDIHAVHEAGDHLIVLGDVRALDVEHPESPLLFFKGDYVSLNV
ncbi:flavin reductase family protein [Novosphingobium sp. KCTC 2891]|uniref:flavin reductase family protein n=1 Tax=Novosphingobium sp. KCTC 2891 TaxID=2989730 RepID=UPI00222201E2|nr:flavin reductase family protein [Novosphingobium sp. KCTC 2891]MCW1384887.1 flavin reductase family protein [Novosphingobium sp. KCTC 2891]